MLGMLALVLTAIAAVVTLLGLKATVHAIAFAMGILLGFFVPTRPDAVR